VLFVNFRRLPPLLKVCWIVSILLGLGVAIIAAAHFLRLFGLLAFLPDLPPQGTTILLSIVPLAMALNFPVYGYARRFGRGPAPLRRAPKTWRGQLASAVLLAALPLGAILVATFAVPGPTTADVIFGLQLAGLLLIAAAYLYVMTGGSQPAPVGGLASTDAGSGGTKGAASQQASPFKWGWWSFDLGQYRPCDGTYCFYPYESLPPIRALNGTLDWLGPLDPATDQQMEIHRNAPDARGQLATIQADAATLGLTLPDAFVRLMGSPELQDRIPSCTACTFGLPKRILPAIGGDPGYIIRFLNDQQDVLIWYLYLTPTGEERVLVTPYEFDESEGANPNDLPDETRKAVLANTIACAPSFESFVYRFWLENSIWFKLNDGKDDGKLTDEERRYLDHYEHQGNTPPGS
jgi:hypothetical protein